MLVVDVREMRMGVGQCAMPVRMRMRLGSIPGEAVLVTVMVVVHV
jgi:hypothetical protein